MGASQVKDGIRAIWDISFYEEIAAGRRKTLSTCAFFVLLIALASAVAVGFVTVKITPSLTAFNVYPEDLEISLSPQLNAEDVTQELPPKLEINKPYPQQIPMPPALKPIVSSLCGVSSTSSFFTMLKRASKAKADAKAGVAKPYPELSLVTFRDALPDGEYPQAKLDAECRVHQSLTVFTDTAVLICPPQLFCPNDDDASNADANANNEDPEKPTFRASFWTLFFRPPETVVMDHKLFTEYVSLISDNFVVKWLFGYRLLAVAVNLIMYLFVVAFFGALAFWLWVGVTISCWIALNVFTCGSRNFPFGGIAQMSVYPLVPWLLLWAIYPTLLWWLVPYVYVFFICLLKVHFKAPPTTPNAAAASSGSHAAPKAAAAASITHRRNH